jgi:hypothetical protein
MRLRGNVRAVVLWLLLMVGCAGRRPVAAPPVPMPTPEQVEQEAARRELDLAVKMAWQEYLVLSEVAYKSGSMADRALAEAASLKWSRLADRAAGIVLYECYPKGVGVLLGNTCYVYAIADRLTGQEGFMQCTLSLIKPGWVLCWWPAAVVE